MNKTQIKKIAADFKAGGIRVLPGYALKATKRAAAKSRKVTLRLESRLLGDKLPYYCPCCDTHLRKFVNGGYDKKPNKFEASRYTELDQDVNCPICGALPRHRILVSWLDGHVDRIKDKRILHFAQEKSVRLWLDRNRLKYTTADLYKPADLKIDIENTSLEDAAYDLIICNHVLEHVPDYKKALRELHRILAPEGWIILSFPVDLSLESVYEDESIITKEDRRKHFGQSDHLRVFGRDSAAMLEGFGFEVLEIRGENCDGRIKPVIGPANYDYNVLWRLSRKEQSGE